MTNYDKLCRACLISMDSSMYTFYDNVSTDDYLFCTSVEIVKDVKLPKGLCNICYNLLTKLVEFKKKCIQSNNILLACASIKSEREILTNETNEERFAVSNSDNSIGDWSENESKIKLNVPVEDKNSTFNIEEPVICNGKSMIFADPGMTVSLKKCKKDIDARQNYKPSVKTKKHVCEICKKKFSSSDRFEAHKAAHNNKDAPKCIPCNRPFVTWSGLRRHNVNWHAKVSLKNFKCHICGKIATSRETLAAHQKLHKERRQYICNVCGRSYASNSNLESHLDTHRDNRERQFTCDICGKKFLTKQSLVSHISRCHTGRRYICDFCNFPFTGKYNLAKHIQKHQGKLNIYKCKVCDKTFSSKQVYVEHERIHSGERPFKCKYCPKSFISRKRVTDHHRTHTGEKPHKCNICNHLFTQRGSLTRHLKKLHERPFQISQDC